MHICRQPCSWSSVLIVSTAPISANITPSGVCTCVPPLSLFTLALQDILHVNQLTQGLSSFSTENFKFVTARQPPCPFSGKAPRSKCSPQSVAFSPTDTEDGVKKAYKRHISVQSYAAQAPTCSASGETATRRSGTHCQAQAGLKLGPDFAPVYHPTGSVSSVWDRACTLIWLWYRTCLAFAHGMIITGGQCYLFVLQGADSYSRKRH